MRCAMLRAQVWLQLRADVTVAIRRLQSVSKGRVVCGALMASSAGESAAF
jgi:hypothetical protein